MRPLRLPLLALFFPMVVAAAALPPAEKAPTDQAVFHRFVLENGLRVMLVSDPRFNLSAATLAVGVGALDDPPEREGFAHFLEHMISRGNAKYPQVDGLAEFIATNGGRRNAATGPDRTYYLFEVRHDALAEALDRTAHVFLSPAFPEEWTVREINAVHNEAMRHVQDDVRRRLGVMRELYAPDSPERKISVGYRETLAGSRGADLRVFWEKMYSADRMALAVAGKASIEELEKMVRGPFSAILRRDLAPIVRKSRYLPRKPALRFARIESLKEARDLLLEFSLPSLRAEYVSKPDDLLSELIGHGGPGGLEDTLKRAGLANSVSAYGYDRTDGYSSFRISVPLTPEGEKDCPRVLQHIFSYLRFLRESPHPADLHRELARVARWKETHEDRGEGYALTNKLAIQLLSYPLEVAERATDAWGPPDEESYRRILGALTPDNLLVALLTKEVPAERRERLYQTAYSYREDTGPAYDALVNPPRVAEFRLPGPNPFLPEAPAVLAERPVRLIHEPGLELHYSPDLQFERPQTALVFRFVGTRALAGLESEALSTLFNACLQDFLAPAYGEARRAGVSATAGATLSGFSLSASGYGDSALRYAKYVAENARSFTLSPERFEACRERTLRGLRSTEQNEAVNVAQMRRRRISQEFDFAPTELIPAVARASWADVEAFARRWFARGKVEAVVHGHLAAEDAVRSVRDLARLLGSQPAAEGDLLRPRYLQLAPGEDVVDAGPIEGVNSVFARDVMLPDDSPTTRALALVLSSFIRTPFFTELRSKQQLGYIVSSGSSPTHRDRHLTFLIQSSVYPPDELRRRVDAFLPTLPPALAALPAEKWSALIAGARSTLEAKPKSLLERASRYHLYAFSYEGDWEQRADTLKALESLTQQAAAATLTALLDPARSRRRSVLLWSKKHTLTEEVRPAFADRAAWKATRTYR